MRAYSLARSRGRKQCLADETAAEADGNRMGTRAGLQLRQQVTDVRLDRLLAEEQPLTDLAVHEAVRDQLQHFDLAGGRLLLELLERRGEGNDLGTAVRPAGRDGLEAPRMVHITAQDLLTLSCVHEEGYRPAALLA
jgi:hypothetical protein